MKKEDVLESVTDRFERRLTNESVRVVRWMFVFWVGQVALNVWVVLTLLHATKLR